MVCIPCIVIPLCLFIWHKFLQPVFLKFWNPWGAVQAGNNNELESDDEDDDNDKITTNTTTKKSMSTKPLLEDKEKLIHTKID
jgi:hypothetical protein